MSSFTQCSQIQRDRFGDLLHLNLLDSIVCTTDSVLGGNNFWFKIWFYILRNVNKNNNTIKKIKLNIANSIMNDQVRGIKYIVHEPLLQQRHSLVLEYGLHDINIV